MILPPSPIAAAAVMEKLRQAGTVRAVKARGIDEDEAELRQWQREVKARSRARRRK